MKSSCGFDFTLALHSGMFIVGINTQYYNNDVAMLWVFLCNNEGISGNVCVL